MKCTFKLLLPQESMFDVAVYQCEETNKKIKWKKNVLCGTDPVDPVSWFGYVHLTNMTGLCSWCQNQNGI